MTKRVLLTGIAGFIGSHFVEHILQKTDWFIVGIDSFKHKGTYTRLNDTEYDTKRVDIIHHDLTSEIDDVMIKKIGDIDFVFNLASDSAVERSITDPSHCVMNNCQLILNVLEYVRKVNKRLFHMSSDEIFGETMGEPHKEWDIFLPSNPYAASKCFQENLICSYYRTYGIQACSIISMNALGSRQNLEKFVPKLISYVHENREMPLYADGTKIGSRSYIHCKYICEAFIFLTKIKLSRYCDGVMQPDRFNVCGQELSNLEVGDIVATHMGKKRFRYRLVQSDSMRPGYDRRYALCDEKIRKLGFVYPRTTVESIKEVVDWTVKHSHWM